MPVRDAVAVAGVLPAGRFTFEPASRDAHSSRLDTTVYEFDKVHAQDVEFDVDEVRIHISESEFDRCLFRQHARITKANRREFAYSFSYVLLGMQRRSVYRDCTFDHVDFGIRGGGCHLGDARFERCTFHHCVFRQFDAKEADFVECAFIGTMTHARFYGCSESADGGLRHNSFDGNDLTRAKLRRVEFRGVDLRTSGLPDGPEYLRVDDFLAKAQQARTAMSAWPDAEREKAEWLLKLYEERWSEPLFHWRNALADADSRLWPLLESL
jgi:Pentapeptide repeats (8 copies)